MHLICLGLSHQTAPVALRERLAYNEADLQETLSQFERKQTQWTQSFQEFAILSTCNRVELYALQSPPSERAIEHDLLACLAETRKIPVPGLEPYLYRHHNLAAVTHLCRVAAGLESIVLGESQILGQVADAHRAARGHRTLKRGLNELFQAAIRAGKRARHETGIDRNPASIGSVAVHLAQRIVKQLAQAKVLVIGAGEMAELALEALHKRVVHSIAVANRTAQRATELAGRWGGQGHTLTALPEILAEVDIVITSTGAPQPIIDVDLVQPIMAKRSGRPLVFIDIAVPRNVAAEVADLAAVHLFDIDDLQNHLQDALSKRQAEVPKVEAIVAEEVAKFETWLQKEEVLPLITELRHQAETIRQQSLERTLDYLPDLDPETMKHIQHLSRSIVNKLLHEPTHRLRLEATNGFCRLGQEAACPCGVRPYAETVRHLFGLDSGDQAS